MPAQVLSMIYDGQRRLEDTVNAGFARVDGSINQLRGETVSRHDYERFLDRITIDWAAGQQRHEADIARVTAAVEAERAAREAQERANQTARQARREQAERDRKVDFRWRVGLLGTGLVSLAGAVISHIPHL